MLLAGSVALALAGPALAESSCTSTTSWGSLGPPGLEFFGHAFSKPGAYIDCYTFSLASAADSFGGTLEIDPAWNFLNLDISSVSLYLGGLNGTAVGSDTSPLMFSFGGLTGGGQTYTLAVSSSVTSTSGYWPTPVGYLGVIRTVASIAAPVPEPQLYALMLAGVLGVGLAALRQRRR